MATMLLLWLDTLCLRCRQGHSRGSLARLCVWFFQSLFLLLLQ